MKLKFLKASSLLFIIVVLQACGTPHLQPIVASEDLSQYSSGYISKIDIQSQEQNGDSLEMNKKMEAYAQSTLTKLISKNSLMLVSPSNASDKANLEFALDLDIVYGSRAARYWGGFGAGKGSVNSTFEVKDSQTGEIKYSASGKSDLSVGAFGGSMEAVIKKNIDKVVSGYAVAAQ